jgi:hypothetical protein
MRENIFRVKEDVNEAKVETVVWQPPCTTASSGSKIFEYSVEILVEKTGLWEKSKNVPTPVCSQH